MQHRASGALMRILFVGEAWLGSCARSMKEALARRADVVLDEVNTDAHFPAHRQRWLRGIHRVLAPSYRNDFERQILARIAVFRPDVVMTYKGEQVRADLLRRIRAAGAATVNIYPDLSPHAHGAMHRQAVGMYDLVVSTKPFHPTHWQSTYGYTNTCQFVPQGYDPQLHRVAEPPAGQAVDVAMAATWRPEYHDLMRRFAAALDGAKVSVAIAGNGWDSHRAELPGHWRFGGGLQGQAYVQWLRQGRVCLAPVTREIQAHGQRQPGDEDTTRTYELAAAHCFFIHRRTPFVQTLYDEATEVPFYDTPEELAAMTRQYLADPGRRALMAANAHRRAVPAYSTDSRAAEIVRRLSLWLDGAR